MILAVAALSIMLFAVPIRFATKPLAHHFDPGTGGLRNASFGNAAEFIIICFAIHDRLPTLAKDSITGSIVGTALLAGGIQHDRQRFDGHDQHDGRDDGSRGRRAVPPDHLRLHRPGPRAMCPRGDGAPWSIGRSLLVLGGWMVGVAIGSEILVGAIEFVTKELGLKELFVGTVIVPVVGAAECLTAVQMALRDRLDAHC